MWGPKPRGQCGPWAEADGALGGLIDRSAAGVPPSYSPLRFLSCRWDSERGTPSLRWLHTSPLTETPRSMHRPWTRAVTPHNRDPGASGPYTAVFWACRAFGVSARCVGCSPASLPAQAGAPRVIVGRPGWPRTLPTGPQGCHRRWPEAPGARRPSEPLPRVAGWRGGRPGRISKVPSSPCCPQAAPGGLTSRSRPTPCSLPAARPGSARCPAPRRPGRRVGAPFRTHVSAGPFCRQRPDPPPRGRPGPRAARSLILGPLPTEFPFGDPLPGYQPSRGALL